MISVHVLTSRVNRAGGADIYTSELLARLPGKGLSVTAICHEASADAREWCPIIEVGRGAWTSTPIAWRLSPVLQLASIKADLTRRALRPPDVVIGMAHQIIWAHRAVFGHRPLVYLPHSLIAPEEIKSYNFTSTIQRRLGVWLWRSLERRYLQEACATVRFTHTGCGVLSDYYHIPRAAIPFVVIPQAVPIPPDTPRDDGTGPIRLLCVGRLVASKNVEFLIRALGELRSLDWTLNVLGDGPEAGRLGALTAACGMTDRVHFRGHVDPKPYYREADLLVAPSRLENAPLALLEAMSWGVPTLSIRADGVRYFNATHELVTDQVTGYLADDEADFSSRLARLMVTPSSGLAEVGRRARLIVIERHSWDAHITALTTVVRGAADLPRGHA